MVPSRPGQSIGHLTGGQRERRRWSLYLFDGRDLDSVAKDRTGGGRETMRGGIRWLVIVLAVVVGTLSSLPAWSADSPSSSPSPSAADSTYTVGTLADLNTINPIKALNATEYE